jgi:hypothetical protein
MRPITLKLLSGTLAALALVALPVQAGPDSLTETAVKRFFLARVDDRCHRLDGPAAMAVKAGYLQARNASIRATGNMDALNPFLARAAEVADQIACDAPQLQAQVDAANGAYRLYAGQPRLELPSGRTEWVADRTSASQSAWRLVQYQGDAALGLYGPLSDARFTVMADFGDDTPYAARLLVRNTDVLAAGYINRTAYGLTDQRPAGFDAVSALTFPASGHSEQSVALSPTVHVNDVGISARGQYVGQQQGPVDAVRFDFPNRAYAAIARLDPREDIVVAFDFADGTTRYARFEVGDFVTGLTYITLPSPYGQKVG